MSNTAIERHTVYICYFGLRQPLVQTQVIPYLEQIARGGIRVSLLTFEPDLGSAWTDNERQDAAAELSERGIALFQLAYHKRLSAIATAWDVAAGTMFLRRMIGNANVDVLHGRVHVATLMALLARGLSKRKPKVIFDVRGFFPEEYTDAGVWPENGSLFRLAKRVERWILKRSDGFVILTQKARRMMFPDALAAEPANLRCTAFEQPDGRPIEVIPCCVDLDGRFGGDMTAAGQKIRRELGAEGRRILVHVGALGGLYLTDQIVEMLANARSIDPQTFALFLTQSDPAEVNRLLAERGFGADDSYVARVDASQIPAYLAASDVGVSFVKATYATQSRSPTKIPEYLAAGVPVLANAGVGDVDELIGSENVGVLVTSLGSAGYTAALKELDGLGDVSERCRAVARDRFDLVSVGGEKYRRLYKRLFCKH